MKNIILKFFISIFCIALIGWSLLPFKEDIFPSNTYLENLYHQKDSINQSIVIIDQKIKSSYTIEDSLQEHMKEKDYKLIALKKQHDEKADYIKHTTDVELLEFFSNFNSKNKAH